MTNKNIGKEEAVEPEEMLEEPGEDFGTEKKEPDPAEAALAESFAQKFLSKYQHRNFDGLPGRYNPREDSEAWRGVRQEGFYVVYSLPKGAKTPVASFWAEGDDNYGRPRKELYQINVASLIEPILRHYILKRYSPAKYSENGYEGN